MLKELFPDHTTEEFLEKIWRTKEIAVTHGSPDRFHQLLQIPELASAEALLEAHKGHAVAVHRSDVGELVPHAVQSAAAALDRAQHGDTIQIHRPSESLPSLMELSKSLLQLLGVEAFNLTDSAFYALRGGSPRHADPYDIFVIQLQGSKKWLLEYNDDDTHSIVDQTPWLAGGDPKYRQFTDRAMEVVLEPGSVLFMPKDWWHSTEVVEGPSFGFSVGCDYLSSFTAEFEKLGNSLM